MAEQDDGGPAMMPVKPDGTGMTTAQAIEIALMNYRAGRLSDHIAAALDRAGWALVKRADVAESLFERDVWNALDAAAPKEPGQ